MRADIPATEQNGKSDRKASPRRAAKLGLAALGAVLGIALLEGALGVVSPDLFPRGHLRRFDSELGWTSRPGLVRYRPVADRLVRFEVNDQGFRDRRHRDSRSRRLANGETVPIRRVVVLGDSFAESAQVEREDTWWARIGRELNAHAASAVDSEGEANGKAGNAHKAYWEVHNLGVGDFGTLQAALALEHRGLRYSPDVVVLQVFPLNDIVNNSLSAAYVASMQDTYRPYLDPADDYRSIARPCSPCHWLRSHSRIAAALLAAAEFGGERRLATREERDAYTGAFLRERSLPDGLRPVQMALLLNAFAPQAAQLPEIAEGWRATEVAIDRIFALCERVGAQLVVAVFPHPGQLEPAISRYARDLPYPVDRHAAERRIASYVSDRGVPVLRFVDAFEARRAEVLPFLEGHLNEGGHELVAERLGAELVARHAGEASGSTVAQLR